MRIGNGECVRIETLAKICVALDVTMNDFLIVILEEEYHMGLRVRHSVKIAKGVRVNFGKTGTSISFGSRGLHHTVSTSGRRTTSIDIPGTGISYVTTSGGRKRRGNKRSSSRSITRTVQQAAAQQQRAQQQAAEYEKNVQMVDDYNELIDDIRSIHEVCGKVLDWEEIRNRPAPFEYMDIGPNEKEARRNLASYKPSVFGKIIKSIDQKKQKELEDAIQVAHQEDQDEYNDWKNLRSLADKVLSGDIDSYFYVVSEMHPFDDILDFGSDFDVGTDEAENMEVEFHVKSDKVVPQHVLSLTQTGKLSTKKMTKTMHYDITQDYICSCAIRIAREMFNILPVKRVLVHAMDVIDDESSGLSKDVTVLSVLFEREPFERISFNTIDPSDTIETFKNNMNFKKTQGLKPVDRVDF